MVIATVTIAATAAAAAGTSGFVYKKLHERRGEHMEDAPETTEKEEPASLAPSESLGPLRVMFLSADAGGGHKASAAALTKQFELLYPGSTCRSFHLEELLPNTWPYSDIAMSYKTLTSNPNVWRTIYHVSNAKAFQKFMDWHCLTYCEEVFINTIAAFNPDVIVSVHPNLNLVPCSAARKVGRKMGKKIPFFTVVTDLGSGHDGWFQMDVDKLYLASEKIRDLCVRRGRTPKERIVLTGLPIRHEFELMAEKQKTHPQEHPQEVLKQNIKADLDLDISKPMLLVMGGGEGVGSLQQIVTEMYLSFFDNNVDATICVVCAKNQELKSAFETTNWDQLLTSRNRKTLKLVSSAVNLLKGNRDRGDEPDPVPSRGSVTVVALGFVTRMAEYMAAAEVLITKAGPGTIAEAAAMGLPLLLTDFLPGQEAGNVGLVAERGFGEYHARPPEIARVVTRWLKEPEKHLKNMRENALSFGYPDAGGQIVLDIGSQTHAWLDWNTTRQAQTAV